MGSACSVSNNAPDNRTSPVKSNAFAVEPKVDSIDTTKVSPIIPDGGPSNRPVPTTTVAPEGEVPKSDSVRTPSHVQRD